MAMEGMSQAANLSLFLVSRAVMMVAMIIAAAVIRSSF
jgi:hypothetical protein